MPSYDGASKSTDSSTAASYFSYPVKQAVNSALRRLSTDPFPRSRSKSREPPSFSSLTSTFSGFGNDPHYVPPRRIISPPFQPPPLTPVALSGYKPSTSASEQILSRQLAEEIRLLVPPRLQLVEKWRLLFSLDQDGSSLSTLFDKCEDHESSRGGFVMAIRDTSGGIFGAYLTDTPRPSHGHYYGHGECFLWRATTLPYLPTLGELPPPPSEDTTDAQRMTTIGAPKRAAQDSSGSLLPGVPDMGAPASGVSTPERIRFKAFPYSGSNDYLIFCEQGFFSVGGG